MSPGSLGRDQRHAWAMLSLDYRETSPRGPLPASLSLSLSYLLSALCLAVFPFLSKGVQ
jgi:hypothetical protein